MTGTTAEKQKTEASSDDWSLSNPNLKDLWSCSHLEGCQQSTLRRLTGAVVLLCLTLSWSVGTFAPLYIMWLLWHGGQRAVATSTVLAVLLGWAFVIPVKPWPAAARFWLHAAWYFDGGCSMSFEKREPNDLSIPQMQCYHPHGIFTLGLILNSGVRCSAAGHVVGSELWNKYVGAPVGPVPFVGLAAEKLVQMPVFRHIMVLWTGNIESASKSHLLGKMKRGESFGLCPGGFHELSLFVRGRERVHVKKKGFVYYALKHGYRVVPAYTFGETSTFYNVPGLEGLREKAADWGVPVLCITGPLLFVPLLALVPFGKGVGLHTVHGQGRTFPKVADPSDALVDEYHAWYCGALEALFERHKARFGITAPLEVLT